MAKQRQRRHTAPRVSLSTSVDVTGVSGPEIFTDRLQIVYPLEEYYRQRYKSDCFAQNGTVRSPRYVCDRNGNHFITLTVRREPHPSALTVAFRSLDSAGLRRLRSDRLGDGGGCAEQPLLNAVQVSREQRKPGCARQQSYIQGGDG